MANTFTQIYIHIVFTIQGRSNLISNNHKEELHKYVTGIIRKKKQKLLAIHCMPDHIHLFINTSPDITISDLVRDIKTNSSRFINTKKWMRGKFHWQKGFGAFSYAHSQINSVINYILSQEERHKIKSFKAEYINLLKKFDLKFDNKYLFKWIDEDF